MTTHEDIYERFLIEYDKANITSSYPSLTKHEAVAILNKAYIALISQKFTGNNFRKASFEVDIKAIEDLLPLIITTTEPKTATYNSICATNERISDIPTDMMYYIQSYVKDKDNNTYNVDLVSHQAAQNFKVTTTNNPWMENPVMYMENNKMHFLADIDLFDSTSDNLSAYITYIKMPERFEVEVVEDTSGTVTPDPGTDPGDDPNVNPGDEPGDDPNNESNVHTEVRLIVDPQNPHAIQDFSTYGITSDTLTEIYEGRSQLIITDGSTETQLLIKLSDELNTNATENVWDLIELLSLGGVDFSQFEGGDVYIAYNSAVSNFDNARVYALLFVEQNKLICC